MLSECETRTAELFQNSVNRDTDLVILIECLYCIGGNEIRVRCLYVVIRILARMPLQIAAQEQLSLCAALHGSPTRRTRSLCPWSIL